MMVFECYNLLHFLHEGVTREEAIVSDDFILSILCTIITLKTLQKIKVVIEENFCSAIFSKTCCWTVLVEFSGI